MMQYIKKLLFKDVVNENEPQKISVILRLNCITMCIYFLCLLCTFIITGSRRNLLLCIPCFLAYAFAFYATYINKTQSTVIFAQILTVAWILFFVWQFGWSCGAQLFLFVLLLLNYATSYRSLAWKLTMSILFCLIRIAIFLYTHLHNPMYPLDWQTIVIFQCMNTIFVFVSITTILIVLTKNSQDMEHKLVAYNEKLHKLASTDPLTGLLNRRSMTEYLENKEKECQNGRTDGLSLAIGDIDFFKKVNDTYGHECGDLVLRHLAKLFRENMSEYGEVSRWGGEEFLFAFNHINGDEAFLLLDRLKRKIEQVEIVYKDEVVKATMTFGLSEFDFQRGLEFSLKEADQKLYHGKSSGRNKIVY